MEDIHVCGGPRDLDGDGKILSHFIAFGFGFATFAHCWGSGLEPCPLPPDDAHDYDHLGKHVTS